MHEAVAGRSVFVQQRQVRGAPGDGGDDLERAGQREAGFRFPGRGLDQPGNKQVQPLPSGLVQARVVGGLVDRLHGIQRNLRIRKTIGFQHFVGVFGISRPHGGQVPRRAAFRLRQVVRAKHDGREMPGYRLAVRVGLLRQTVPIRMTHGEGQADPALVVVRQLLGLPVVHPLQPVLKPSQKAIGTVEFAGRAGAQEAPLAQARKHSAQAAAAQVRVGAAPHQLHRLRDELDFADPAPAQLDVVGLVLAQRLAFDLALHVAQRLEHAVVQVAAVNERPHDFLVERLAHPARVDDARLDPGVALPVTGRAGKIALQRRGLDYQRSAVAEGTQAGIDPVHEGVHRALVERPDQLLADQGVETQRVDRNGSVGSSVLGIDEDEVDVGRKVEFAATELAHADNGHLAGLVLRRERQAVPFRHVGPRELQGGKDAGLGQFGQFLQAFLQAAEPVQVAPQDPAHLAVPKPAEFAHERGLLTELAQCFAGQSRQFARFQRPGEPVFGQEMIENLRPACKASRRERRTGQYPCERREKFTLLEPGSQRLVFPQRGERLVGAFAQQAGDWKLGGVHFN